MTKLSTSKLTIKADTVLDLVMGGSGTILTKPLAVHVERHSSPDYRPDVQERISRQLAAKPRVRTGTFSASAWGTIDCQRARVFRFLGVEVDDASERGRMSSVFMDGHWRHLRWQAELLEARLISDIEVPLVSHGGWLRGTADAVMDGEYGVEIKGINPHGYSRLSLNGPARAHVVQSRIYMAMTGLPQWSILYEDKASNNWREFVVDHDPEFDSKLTADVVSAARSVSDRTLPSPVEDEKECSRCPWRKKCPGVRLRPDVYEKVTLPGLLLTHGQSSRKIKPRRR